VTLSGARPAHWETAAIRALDLCYLRVVNETSKPAG
jgi:hypothetical protein